MLLHYKRLPRPSARPWVVWNADICGGWEAIGKREERRRAKGEEAEGAEERGVGVGGKVEVTIKHKFIPLQSMTKHKGREENKM